jgi:site-specific DNA recombinase
MRRTRPRGGQSGRSAYEHVGPEQWLRTPVPALITEEQHALAQALLSPLATQHATALACARNPRLSRVWPLLPPQLHPQQGRERPSLLPLLGSRQLPPAPRGLCRSRPVRIEEIDGLVWTQVLALRENPALIQAEIERRLQTLRAEHPASHRRDRLERDLTRAQSALRRLIDGYQEQLITLAELRARMPELRKREATLRAELDALDTELQNAETYLKLTETLDAFRARLSANAKAFSIEQRQEIVRLVVREVLLGDDDVTIRHSIPVPSNG